PYTSATSSTNTGLEPRSALPRERNGSLVDGGRGTRKQQNNNLNNRTHNALLTTQWSGVPVRYDRVVQR
ncbi:unnamed protein product, partial [Arctogadus glacialis]